jgi:hypothetical protein
MDQHHAGCRGTDHRSEAGRDLRAIAAFDQADDAARDLAALFERIHGLGGEIGAAFLGATGAANRLADALGAVADVLRDEHAAGSRARRGRLSRDYVADLLGYERRDDAFQREFLDRFTQTEPAVGGPAVTGDRWIWPRQLTLADELEDIGIDHADARPEQHAPRCPALAGLDCDRGCPDGERWNAERARRVAALGQAPDGQPTG